MMTAQQFTDTLFTAQVARAAEAFGAIMDLPGADWLGLDINTPAGIREAARCCAQRCGFPETEPQTQAYVTRLLLLTI